MQIINGDCLDELARLPDASIHAVVTDPPYIIGGTSIGNAGSKSGTWADMENAAFWFSAWLSQCRRVLVADGHMLVCTSWRTLPTMMRAAALSGFAWDGCAVWDKSWIGPGGSRSFRPSYELVLHAAQPDGAITDRSVADVVRVKWHGIMRQTAHAAEKSVDLMRWLVRLVTPPGGTVLDPFAGSGTTGCACAVEGFEFVGIEREPEYADIARQRVAWWSEHGERAVEAQAARDAADAEDAATGQTRLFDW